MRTTTLIALLLAFATSGLLVRQEFPHNEHAELFPLCQGCHLGVSTNDSSAFYPAAELCGRCHDGVQADRVEWTGPVPVIGNLRFDHDAHARAVADSVTLDCENCHSPPDSGRMVVERGIVANCLGCHTHRASDHIVDADCATCHLPLAETAFPAERILELPIPPNHESDGFLPQTHGALAKESVASCSTCHTRERCTSCHVNAATVQAIAQVPAAGPALALPRFAARYPAPSSHQSRGWIEDHPEIASVQACSTCHTRDDCQTCHRAALPAVVAALPARRDVEAPGVTTLLAVVPASHSDPGFARNHGPLAATSLSACTTCHTRESCADCHDRTALIDVTIADAPRSTTPPPVADSLERGVRTVEPGTRFHPPTFLLRHSATAYGRRLECANCHDARVFCRDCHTQSGISTVGGTGRLRSTFHDAEPLWLLRHARAARQGLESCTACHSQRDCLQCHSQLGAFRVNPHGDDFDPRRAQRRNPVICFACHVTDPLTGRT
jgi:hypothetical protein